MARVWATLLAVAILMVAVAIACRISEFPCRRSGRCVRLDKYCDGNDDCGDASDEPKYCTVCNRTYYGDTGYTYELNLQKPMDERLPFLCHLTFTANGQQHGELVQLMFDQFSLGRYEASSLDGCPDGYMQLSELGRPFTGGSWCGASTGYAVYYSETSTVTVSLKLFHSPVQAPFQFQLRYKFVAKEEAVVRFGPMDAPLERGEVVPGTYCSRNFYECNRKRCRLQSPNYPGMYPRNVTCYLTLRQKTVPNCKHAMIAVNQDSEHKVQIKRSLQTMASLNKTSRAVRAWKECTGERDHLIFYDGSSTDDPVLVKFCGGDWLPRVVSRGPEMLVAFHSSPFSVPLHSGGNSNSSPLRGFELDVDVVYSDSDSLDYSRHPTRCEFIVNATREVESSLLPRPKGRAGHVLSPRHTLPPNTTCSYRFQGQPGDLVWIYFVSYSHRALMPPPDPDAGIPPVIPLVPENSTTTTLSDPTASPAPGTVDNQGGVQQATCLTRLRIWDGGGPGLGGGISLGDHCDTDPPRLCDHAALGNSSRVTRPCSAQESYLSSGRMLTLLHHSEDGTALHPANFKLRYEFVDTRLGGEPWPAGGGGNGCARVFRKVKSGIIASPRNVFMFGRGGAGNLSCIYRLEASAGEKVHLTIHNASFGETSMGCTTETHPHTNRLQCVRDAGARLAELQISDVPWRDVRVPRACFCDNATISPISGLQRPLVIISTARVLELHFIVQEMSLGEDFRDFYFHASFEMIPAPECPRRQRLRGSGGEVEFHSPPASRADVNCEGLPWLVEAHENRSLFLLTWGTFLPPDPGLDETVRCPTRNRVLLYSGRPPRLLRVVCPAAPNARQFAVHVFSEEWFLGTSEGSGSTSASTSPGGSGVVMSSSITSIPVTTTRSFGASSFSEVPSSIPPPPPRPPSFLVEFVGIESGVASLSWLEISRSRSSLLQQLQLGDATTSTEDGANDTSRDEWECQHRCPELNACISAVLWCDGRSNCPSGFDEDEGHCGAALFWGLVPPGAESIVAAVIAGIVAATILALSVACFTAARRRRRRSCEEKKRVVGVGATGLGLSINGAGAGAGCRRGKKKRGGAGCVNSEPRRVTTEELLLDPSGSSASS